LAFFFGEIIEVFVDQIEFRKKRNKI
jgi:hypothetical protein